MATEMIDVIDTAVKIGLGALISGSFAYLGVRYSEKSQKQKFLLEHKTQLLEKIINNIDNYFTAWNDFISKIHGIAKHCEKQGEQLNLDRYEDEITIKYQSLAESWQKADSSLAYLVLLDANKAAKAFRKCRSLEYNFRSPIMFDKKIPPHDEIINKRKEYVNAQENVFKELSLFYSSLES